MSKAVAKRQETSTATAYLVSQGMAETTLNQLAQNTRRLLAGALAIEISQLGILQPHKRRQAESDLIETISLALGGLDPTQKEVLSGHFARELLGVGCKTPEGQNALDGICTTLKAMIRK